MSKEQGRSGIISLKVILAISCLVLLGLSAMPVQANYDPENAFSTEVLLNKPGVTYDLSQFDIFIEEGSLKVIKIEEPKSTSGEDDEIVEVNVEEASVDNDDEIPEDENEYYWEPGAYYIYRSHYNSNLGVIVYEEMDSLEDYEGLSVKLVIPTKMEEVQREWDTATLDLEFEFELRETLIEFMKEMGYENTGEGSVGDQLTMLSFTKNDVTIYLSSGEGSKSPEGGKLKDESVIWVEGPKGSLDDDLDEDVMTMLEFLEIEPELWDGAKRESESFTDLILVPDVNIEPEEFEWGVAISTELRWLIDQSVVDGLSEDDIEEISSNAKAGNSGWNSRIVYEEGEWEPYYDTENPQVFEKDTFSGCILVILVLLAMFSYSRLQRKDILNNLNRKNIHEFIKATPGIHFKALLRELDLKPGTLSHHLNVLEKEDYIKSKQDGMYRRFYLYEEKSELKIKLTTLQQKILNVVKEYPGISQSGVSRQIGSNRMLVNYHTRILNEAGILKVEKKGRENLCYITGNAMLYLNS